MDIFDTRVMLRALELMTPPRTFVLDTFFGGGMREEVHETEYVEVDIRKGSRKMAPFQRPISEGKVVEQRGFASRTIRVPYVKPKTRTRAAEMIKRQPGENPYVTRTPADRARNQLNLDLADLQDQIVRREEWMAVRAVVDGVVTIQGDDINAEIDFLRSASHNITLSGGSTWNPGDNPQIDSDLVTWRGLISRDAGLTARDALCGENVAEVVLHDEGVQALLDNRRTEAGMLRAGEAPIEGVTYLGNLRGIDLWAYEEWFEDDAGALQPMIPPNRICLGARGNENGCKRHYGAIQDLKATTPVRFFPKSWEENDPSVRWAQVQSAPLPATHIPDAFVSVDVLSNNPV